MKQKNKLWVLLSIIVVVSISTVVIVCYAASTFDKNDHTTWFEPAKNGGVDDTLLEQIEVGMTFSEIVNVIGKPQRDIGSGSWLMEWELKSGNKLVVCFRSMSSENNENTFIATSNEYYLISYDIYIKSK